MRGLIFLIFVISIISGFNKEFANAVEKVFIYALCCGCIAWIGFCIYEWFVEMIEKLFKKRNNDEE